MTDAEKIQFAKASTAIRHLAQLDRNAAVGLLAEFNASSLSAVVSSRLRRIKWSARLRAAVIKFERWVSP